MKILAILNEEGEVDLYKVSDSGGGYIGKVAGVTGVDAWSNKEWEISLGNEYYLYVDLIQKGD